MCVPKKILRLSFTRRSRMGERMKRISADLNGFFMALRLFECKKQRLSTLRLVPLVFFVVLKKINHEGHKGHKA